MATKSNKEVFVGGIMKLYKEQFNVDVLLKAGESNDEGAHISAHKFLLAARSEVFKKIFESDKFKALDKLETITLSDMKHEEVEALVEFMYSDDGSLSKETLNKHVKSLYIAADKYEILHLRDLCRSHLKSTLDSANALKILELAQIPFDEDLHKAALATVKELITKISNSPEFKIFFVSHPDLIAELAKSNYCATCDKYCLYCTDRSPFLPNKRRNEGDVDLSFTLG